jgi:hypothetical protein
MIMSITRFTAAALAIVAFAAPIASAQEPEVRPITVVGAIIDPNAPQTATEEEDASVAELAVIGESDELPAASAAAVGTNLSEAVEAQ